MKNKIKNFLDRLLEGAGQLIQDLADLINPPNSIPVPVKNNNKHPSDKVKKNPRSRLNSKYY